MPIAPKYSWQETDTGVQVHVQITGVSRKRLDVFSTSALIKVNAPPYLLAVDLAHDVDDDKSAATIDSKGVTFSLVKKVPGTWGQLEAEGSLDEIAKRREASIDESHAKANAARQAKLDKKKADETKLKDRQWGLEKAKRRLVEQRKQEEFDAEATDLKRWQASLHDPAANDSGTESEDDEYGADEEKEGSGDTALAEGGNKPMPDHPEYHGRGFRVAEEEDEENEEDAGAAAKPAEATPNKAAPRKAGADIWDGEEGDTDDDDESSSSDDSDSDSDDGGSRLRAPQTIKPLPPPRRRLEPVEVSFTKLETDVLPAREKREVELKQYKKEQMAKTGLLDTLDIAERQPVFLKDKGDALYAQGNYMGAINAYSTAIQLDPDHLLSYANRAAAWLKAGSAHDCLGDCDRALELLRPRLRRYEEGDAEEGELEKFRRTMTRVLSRRGAALCQMDELAHAVEAYEEAVKFSPDDEALKLNLEEVRAATEPADCTTLRKRADARFKAGDPSGAAEAYTVLLTMPDLPASERTAIISNRAAAHLKSGEFQAALRDCNEGLVGLLEGCRVPGLSEQLHSWVSERLLLPEQEGENGAHETSSSSEVPLPGGWAPGESKRSSLQRILSRRGAAYSHLRLYREATDDLASAACICRSHGDEGPAAALEADVEKIREIMEARQWEQNKAVGGAAAAGEDGQEDDAMEGLD